MIRLALITLLGCGGSSAPAPAKPPATNDVPVAVQIDGGLAQTPEEQLAADYEAANKEMALLLADVAAVKNERAPRSVLDELVARATSLALEFTSIKSRALELNAPTSSSIGRGAGQNAAQLEFTRLHLDKQRE